MSLVRLRKLRPAPFFVIPGLATERGQAIARLCWIPAFTLYLFLCDRLNGTSQHGAVWTLLGLHFLFALTIWSRLCLDCKYTHLRLAVATAVDQILLAGVLYLAGEVAAPFILMPLLLTFGSGLRYGRDYAVFSASLSATLTCVVVMFSPYWNQYPAIRIGILLGAVLLPFYVFRLTDAHALRMRTDSLTGLRNRLSFDELLEDTCQGAHTAKHDNAIITLDLDGFKKVNDVQGHDRGDLVLKHVAYALRVELSKFGLPARFGGDEFAVVVTALNTREELEAALARFLKRTTEIGELFGTPLGASMGVFYLEPGTVVTPSFVFKAADQLMYQAKKRGKNQFVTSTNQTFSANGDLIEQAGPRSVEAVIAELTQPKRFNIPLDELVRSQM